ncbi:MAG: cation:proton antiporter [Egibacteraceae bacterium]
MSDVVASPVLAAVDESMALVFVELGAVVLALALLGRLASNLGFSPIPLYLLVGLLLGDEGIVPLRFSGDFVEIGAQVGVLLLLFMLGLEYTGDELRETLSSGLPSGLVDLVLNATPGFLFGLALGWSPAASFVLAGVTYISSSGVIAKLLSDLDRVANRETPAILTVLVLEDLAMAVYLPILGILLIGTSLLAGVASLAVAVATVVAVLWLALRFGDQASEIIESRSDEIVVLTIFGTVLLVGGLAEQVEVSAAVGAFLVGVALSGRVAEQAQRLLEPVRDLFAAVFFLYFGLQINPAEVPAVAAAAVALGVLTTLTKGVTGWWAAARLGVSSRGRMRAATGLVARGEFSIVIAGLGVAAGVEPALGPLAAAYVLFMAVFGTILARFAEPLHDRLPARLRSAGPPRAGPAAGEAPAGG